MVTTQRFIKAKETAYANRLFRSRLEARWAVFLDTLRIRWEYEPERYELVSISYLPDFWLPDLKIWLEIKPEEDEDADKMMGELADKTGFEGFVFTGKFDPKNVHDCDSLPQAHKVGPAFWDCSYVWCECPFCAVMGVEFEGRSARLDHLVSCRYATSEQKDSDRNHNWNSGRLQVAYLTAANTRFEPEPHLPIDIRRFVR